MDPLIHDICTRCKLGVDFTPRLFTSGGWDGGNHGTHCKGDRPRFIAGLGVLEFGI